jgi:uncharacterized beta-barrel protein YwiB (DUF1934 family)
MKNVKITVQSKTTDECLKTVARGKLAERLGRYYAIYEETEKTGLKGTKTTIKWNRESVIILRHGVLTYRQELVVGKTDSSVYKTPYLNIPIETTTKSLRVSLKDGKHRIQSEYIMKIGSEEIKKMRLDIVVEED